MNTKNSNSPDIPNQNKLYAIGFVGSLIVIGIILIFTGGDKTGNNEVNNTNTEVKAEPPITDCASCALWTEVKPPETSFNAKFPIPPDHTAGSMPIPDSDASIEQDSYIATDPKGNIYFIVTSLYPLPFDDQKTEDTLRTALNGMVSSSPENILEDSQMNDYKGLPSLEFIMKDKSETIYQGKLFAKDRTLYQVFVGYAEENLEKNEYRYFLESFSLPK